MAPIRENAIFQLLGVKTKLEHNDVVIALGYNVAAVGEEVKKLIRWTSDVGTDTEGEPTACDLVRNASGAIVTDRQGSDANLTHNLRKRSFVWYGAVAVRKSFAA